MGLIYRLPLADRSPGKVLMVLVWGNGHGRAAK